MMDQDVKLLGRIAGGAVPVSSDVPSEQETMVYQKLITWVCQNQYEEPGLLRHQSQ